MVIRSMIEDGSVAAEPSPGWYDRMNLTMLTTAIFWPVTDELVSGIRNVSLCPELMLIDILYPHLTEKGKREYRMTISKLNAS